LAEFFVWGPLLQLLRFKLFEGQAFTSNFLVFNCFSLSLSPQHSWQVMILAKDKSFSYANRQNRQFVRGTDLQQSLHIFNGKSQRSFEKHVRLLNATCKTPHTQTQSTSVANCERVCVSVGLRRGTKKSKQNKMFYLGVSACVCDCGVCLLVSVGTKQKKNKKATVDSSHIKSFSHPLAISFALFSFFSWVSATFVAATWQKKNKEKRKKEKSKTKIKVKSQQRITSKFNALFIGIFRGFSGGGRPTYPKMQSERETARGREGER